MRILDDWLNSFMLYTENSEPPTLFRLWTGIATIAACLKRKCFLSWGFITFYPNMYIVLVGPSGCRKGTAMGPGYNMLQDLGIKMAAEAITREALIRELKTSTDSSVNTTLGTANFHASLTIFSQELTVFLGYNSQQLMADMADWYDCRKTWTYRTKNMGTDEIINVWVNLFGATTPELLQSTLPRDAIGGGLTSRVIFVYASGKAKRVAVPLLSPEEIELGEQLTSDLERIHMMNGQFKLSKAFMENWVDWYSDPERNQSPFDDYRFNGYCERRPGHIMKLSMICCASRGEDMILDLQDFDRALTILQETEVMMPQTFGGVGKSDIADLVHKISMILTYRESISYKEIMTKLYQDMDTNTLDKVVSTLFTMGIATSQTIGGKRMLVRTEVLGK